MRESIVMKVRNIHCDTTEMADAWLKLWPGQFTIKGPVESQYHEVHNQVPYPTASSKMYQQLFVMQSLYCCDGWPRWCRPPSLPVILLALFLLELTGH